MYIPFSRLGSIQEIGAPACSPSILQQEAERRAGVLASMGIGRGSRVAIIHGNSPRFFMDLFAVWTVGATAICLDGGLTAAELKTVASFGRPQAILIDGEQTIEDFGVPVLKLADMPTTSKIPLPQDGELEDPAVILFTSGTTGNPKGVVLSFRAILARIALNARAIGTDTLERTLVTLPTHFGHGLIGNSLTPLFSGGSLLLHPPGIQLAQNLGRVIDEHRISFLSSVPTLWRMVLRLGAPPTGNSLSRVHVGSAPLSTQLWSEIAEWCGTEVVNCYGITETANWIAGASSRADGFVEGLIGAPWGGAAAVRDDNGVMKAVGEGEIIVQTPSLMTGYLERPELTAAALEDGWYRTGDFGRVDEQGRIFLTGRIKDEINRAGIKVQPAEIDILLEGHPSVAEACVFGMSDEVSGEIVAAAVKLEPGVSETAESLRDWCRERLRRVAIPDRWFFVDEIPRNARGKVSRDAVRRALAGTPSSAAVSSPGTAVPSVAVVRPAVSPSRVRETVERAWTQVINRRTFAANLPWDEAGGDSLKALHLWFLIESEIGFRLPLDALDNRATPEALVTALEAYVASHANGKDATPDGLPLIFFFPPAEGDMPAYARFRTAFEGKYRFKTIDYPSWSEMLRGGAGAELLIEAALSQILAATKENDICLIYGYSFGGLVAWETARRLSASRRQVAFLGLIDTQFISPPQPKRKSIVRVGRFLRLFGSSRGRVELSNFLVHSALGPLTERRAFGVLRWIERSLVLLPGRAAFNLRLRLLQHLRMIAFERSPVSPAETSVTLFRSDDYDPRQPDYGWDSLSGNVTIVPIRGSHTSLFEPPMRDELSKEFGRAVDQANGAEKGESVATSRDAVSATSSMTV